MRFHDLRHSVATILLIAGIHPKVVQQRMGHSTIAMTLDVYSHVLPSMQQEAAEKIDDMFRHQLRVLGLLIDIRSEPTYHPTRPGYIRTPRF